MFYCFELARFLSRDMRPRPGKNRYIYVSDDPTGLVDANGLEEEPETPEEKSSREAAERKAREAMEKANEERRKKREGKAVVEVGEIDTDEKRPKDAKGRVADVMGVTTFKGTIVVQYECNKEKTTWSVVKSDFSFTINVDIESLERIKKQAEKALGQDVSDEDVRRQRRDILDYESTNNASKLKFSWDSNVTKTKSDVEKQTAPSEDELKKTVKEKLDGLVKYVADETYAVKEADTQRVNKDIKDEDRKMPLPSKAAWEKIFQSRISIEIKPKGQP